MKPTHQTGTTTVVDAHSQLFDWSHLELSLSGAYQLQNLSLVLSVVAVLQRRQVALTNTAVRDGLRQVKLPGRLTVLQNEPLIIADGAHNPDGMTALVASTQQLLTGRDLIWVVGVLRDKAYSEMLAHLLSSAKLVITNTPDNPERALPATKLAQVATKLASASDQQPEIIAATDIQAALELAQQRATANSAIIVTGSFYVMRELQRAGWPGLGQ